MARASNAGTKRGRGNGEGMVMVGDQVVVTVRRQWNDHATAEYRLCDIAGLHWDDTSGGVGRRAPRPFLHGYVMCDAMVSGGVSHSCRHGPPPHRIKVCVVKKDNTSAVLRALQSKLESQMKPTSAHKPTPTAMVNLHPEAMPENLLDYRLRDGTRLGDATREQVCAEAEFYRVEAELHAVRYITLAVGLPTKAAEALVAHGVGSRERLLSASVGEIQCIPGIGKVAMAKISAYRNSSLADDRSV